MSSIITKVCVACGKDVSRSPRTKDAHTGKYYCQPCWARRVEEAHQAEVIPDSELLEVEPSASDDKERRTAIAIISVGTVVGLIVVGTLVYILFLRDRWEDGNRERLLTLCTEADALVARNKLAEGRAKYEEALALLADRSVRDPKLNEKLANARRDSAAVSARMEAQVQAEHEVRRHAEATAKRKQQEADQAERERREREERDEIARKQLELQLAQEKRLKEDQARRDAAAREQQERQKAEAAQQEALRALLAPVVNTLDNSFVRSENCTPAFAKLVRGRVDMGIASSPQRVVTYEIQRYTVSPKGDSATVYALVKYSHRRRGMTEEVIPYYLELRGDRWLINLIDYTD